MRHAILPSIHWPLISLINTKMAALTLAPAKRFALPSLASLTGRPAWSIPCTPSSSKSTLSQSEAAPAASSAVESSYSASLATPWYLPALPLLDSLAELFPPLLWAVPKHKVTHSRKSMRSANKGLKNKTSTSRGISV